MRSTVTVEVTNLPRLAHPHTNFRGAVLVASPTLSARTCDTDVIGVGEGLVTTVPSPIWPSPFTPHRKSEEGVTAPPWSVPNASCVTLVRDSGCGVDSFV